MSQKDIGRVFPRGTVLARIISPYTFEQLEEIVAPLEENLLIAVTDELPFSRVNPGDFGFLVADWSKAERIRR